MEKINNISDETERFTSWVVIVRTGNLLEKIEIECNFLEVDNQGFLRMYETNDGYSPCLIGAFKDWIRFYEFDNDPEILEEIELQI